MRPSPSSVLHSSLFVLAGASLWLTFAARPAHAQVADLSASLKEIREALKLPGAAGVVMRDGKVIAEGVTGVRKLGGEDAIQIGDRFAIGSCTKRMTSYLIARLVQEGKISLDLKLADALPDTPMRDEYKTVTLAQLLAFTGGIAAYERIGPKMTPELFDTEGTVVEREVRFVRHVLQLPPAGAIGKESRYSNASYMLAAYVVNKVTGKDFVALMDEYVFRPLAMTRAGWGRPSNAQHPNEPWLHIARPDGYEAEPDIVRPPEVLFRAAGNAHMSVADLARFANEQLAATHGRSAHLKSAAAKQWLTVEGRAPEGRSVHAGGTPWLAACYAVWPQHNLVAAIAVNGGTPDDAACKQFVQKVEAQFLAGGSKA